MVRPFDPPLPTGTDPHADPQAAAKQQMQRLFGAALLRSDKSCCDVCRMLREIVRLMPVDLTDAPPLSGIELKPDGSYAAFGPAHAEVAATPAPPEGH